MEIETPPEGNVHSWNDASFQLMSFKSGSDFYNFFLLQTDPKLSRFTKIFVWGFWKKLFGGFRRIHNGVLQLIRNSFWIFGKKIIVDRKMIHERACYGYVLFLWSFFEVFFGY